MTTGKVVMMGAVDREANLVDIVLGKDRRRRDGREGHVADAVADVDARVAAVAADGVGARPDHGGDAAHLVLAAGHVAVLEGGPLLGGDGRELRGRLAIVHILVVCHGLLVELVAPLRCDLRVSVHPPVVAEGQSDSAADGTWHGQQLKCDRC